MFRWCSSFSLDPKPVAAAAKTGKFPPRAPGGHAPTTTTSGGTVRLLHREREMYKKNYRKTRKEGGKIEEKEWECGRTEAKTKKNEKGRNENIYSENENNRNSGNAQRKREMGVGP